MLTFPEKLFNKFPDNPDVIIPAEELWERVIAIAKSLVGQKETPNNSGFVNKDFEKQMKEVGFSKGQAWCSYAGELIWKTAFGQDHLLYNELDKLFSASAVQTYKNFKASKHFKVGTVPKPGALVIWQYGNGWSGHLGVVIDLLTNPSFGTVEGNTNAAGGREGIEMAQKIRKTGQPFTTKGLNLLGFVYLPE